MLDPNLTTVYLVVAKSVCVSVCLSLFMWYIFRPILPPLPEVGCPKFLEIRNRWGKVLERSGLRIEHFLLGYGLKLQRKKSAFFADFPLQNMVETMLSDGLETSGRRVYY